VKPLHEAMLDPALFGNSFGGPTFWAWRSVAKVLDGLPLDERELALYRQITGRQEPATTPFQEMYLVKPRRAGGTLFAAALGLHAALTDYRERLGRGEYATVALIASDRRQARQLTHYIKGLIDDSPIIKAEVANETLETITFAHRVNLEVHTTSFRSTRGYSYACCILDELAFYRDEMSASPDVELIRAVRPGLANLGGRLIGLSSPHSRRGHLYAMYQAHYGKPSDILVIQAGGPVLNPTISASVIERARAEDPVAARSEWGAEFREDISAYLTDELIEAAMPGRLKRGPRLSAVAFCDMSGGVSDSAALGIAHSETVDGETIVLLDHLEVVPAPHKPAAVAGQFAETLKRFGLSRVVGDRYSAGWCAGAYEAHGITYEAAELDKSAIYNEVLPLYSERRVELIEDARLVAELRLLERKARAGGRPDNVDHAPRAHDDAANAACGALWLAMKEQATLERPGAYIKLRQLLSGARRVFLPSGDEAPEGLRKPIRMPAFLDGIFACIAGGVGADPDSIGAVFFGTSASNHDCAPLVILDWAIEELGAYSFDMFLQAIAARLASLIARTQEERSEERCLVVGAMTGFRIGGILIEPEGIGAVLDHQARAGGAFDIMELSAQVAVKTLSQRILDGGAHINGGHVAIIAAAFEERQQHQGVTKNHLLSQLVAFGVDGKQAPGCLLAAFATGCAEAFVADKLRARTV
jgi:hypothetical protein